MSKKSSNHSLVTASSKIYIASPWKWSSPSFLLPLPQQPQRRPIPFSRKATHQPISSLDLISTLYVPQSIKYLTHIVPAINTGTKGADPTNGFVKFIDQASAQSQGIIKTNANDVYVGVDFKNAAPNGRQSVRLESKTRFQRGLFILDLAHMPTGCGTWPALSV